MNDRLSRSTRGQEREDFEKFQTWLFSLNRSELLNAIQFSFKPSEGAQSHEYELLREMIELQTPTPTPVHPRALGYKLSSQFGPSLDYEHGASRARWTHPRLFQWTENRISRSRTRRGNQNSRRFHIIARNKVAVAPWGEVYSVGCTKIQQEEDRRIVQGTHFRRTKNNEPDIAIFRDPGSPSSIINMIQVASRGNFLKPLGKSSIPFCSPWLEPTERWFSLSFYLASRYQISLWESFRSQNTAVGHPCAYDPEILRVALPSAVRKGLKQAMEEDKQKGRYLRDSMFWNLLGGDTFLRSGSKGANWLSVWKVLTNTPLLQAHEPLSKLKSNILHNLEFAVAAEMEKAIIAEANEHQAEQTTKKRKKKKKKRSKGVAGRGVGGGSNQLEEVDDEEVVSGDEKNCKSSVDRTLDFPNNQTTKHERNRNIIFALTLLEEITERAFIEVGLEQTPAFESSEMSSSKDRNEEERDNRNQAPIVSTIIPGKPSVEKQCEVHEEPSSNQAIHENGTVEKAGTVTTNEEVPIAEETSRFQWPLAVSSKSGTISRDFSSDLSSSQHRLPQEFYRPIDADGLAMGASSDNDVLDGWPFTNRYQARERSILSEFFHSQEETFDEDDKLMEASTAASISSSTYKDVTVVADEEIEKITNDDSVVVLEMNTIKEDERNMPRELKISRKEERASGEESKCDSHRSDSPFVDTSDGGTADLNLRNEKTLVNRGTPSEDSQNTSLHSFPDCRSPSPEAPRTPPPTLSPILVSLADLRKLKRPSPERLSRSPFPAKSRSFSATATPGSLPSSPVPPQTNGLTLTQSWSREDLRIAPFRDDHDIKPKVYSSQLQRTLELQQSYKAVAVKSLAKPIASSKGAYPEFRSHFIESSLKREQQKESCARSETAVESHREDNHSYGDSRRAAHDENENKSVKDESITITSTLSQREPEEIASIREERNSFRDMCLTLGAEVAKLKAILAAQQATLANAPADYQDSFNHPLYRPGSFDPNGMSPFFHGMQRGQRLGPMSDAGLHRGGDHESQVSEDDTYEVIPQAPNDSMRPVSSSVTLAGSDASVLSSNAMQNGPTGVMPFYDSVAVHELQSRLTKDILQFLNATRMQLKKLDGKRRMAVERFSRLVKATWPRAQAKLYGSHMSGLCLPSSDLDFVICLPAVHNYAPALAPGVLEGRNAINESSQKLLARELKGESWIDPRSIKLIERTVVPVIKVSTKDTRARIIQLDISFDSPEHHGLEANQMVSQILESLPLIRPLMLVLKQFLIDRALLTSYTGGLSSYCLFLMVARYLQDQSPSCGDCGSLLMGFLDFYGNHFDPRATGISVRRRQYFARPNHTVASYQRAGQPIIWNPPHPKHVGPKTTSSTGSRDHLRRNSFSDSGSVDGVRRNQKQSLPLPPRFLNGDPSPRRFAPHNVSHSEQTNNALGHGRPFSFDPLFVEDPLSSSNNVGRNAFRIFQVQRAFSDAHRALVASLEWDFHSSGDLNDGVDYPLLKCLLQSEDVLYEL